MSLLFDRDKSGSLRTYHLQGRELGKNHPGMEVKEEEFA